MMAEVIPMPETGLVAAYGVEVECNGLRGVLLAGGRRGEEKVELKGGAHGAPLEVISAPEFERRAGRGATKKWRKSLRVREKSHLNKASVADWLQSKGSESAYKVVGKALAVYWPEDNSLYKGHLTEYRAATGEHRVVYSDGESEWIHLCLQSILWLEGEPSYPGPEKAAAARLAASHPPDRPNRAHGGGQSKSNKHPRFSNQPPHPRFSLNSLVEPPSPAVEPEPEVEIEPVWASQTLVLNFPKRLISSRGQWVKSRRRQECAAS